MSDSSSLYNRVA